MKKSLSILISLVCVIPFFAEGFLDSEEDEDVIVVQAGKIAQNLSDAVENVQVVTSQDIKESGAKNLSEAMKTLPGVTINGPSSGNPSDSIKMQGFDSDYVKILVDGVAVNGDVGGSVSVNAIPVENVDHIEVVQGASSALYGSDAMGGVINIITKKQQNTDDKVKVSGSLSDEFSIKKDFGWRTFTAGSLNLASSKLGAGVTGSFDYTPGKKDYEYYAFAGGYVDYYKTEKRRLGYVRGYADWKDDWGKIGIYGTYADSLQESNFTATGFDSGSTMSYKSKRIEAVLSCDFKVSEKLSFSGFGSFKNFLLDTDFSRFTVNQNNGRFEKSSTVTGSSFIDSENEIRGSWNINQMNDVLFGLNGNLQTIDGDSFDKREMQFLISSFVQDSLTFCEGKLIVVPGVRFDVDPDFQNTMFMVTPKLSLKFSPSKKTAIRFSYGMGYKTPTLKQKYWVFYHNYAPGEGNFILNGNPDLESEKSQSFNLSFEQDVKSLVKLNLSGYFNYINDMIDSKITDNTTTPQTRTYLNVGKAVTFGGDVSVSTKLDRFSGRVSYAFTGAKAYNQKENIWEDLSLRVPHRVVLNAGYVVPVIETKISGNVEWNSRQLITTGGSDYSPDYLMTSLNASKSFLDEKIEVYVRIDNFLNNLNFANGTDGKTQEEYFNLYDGTTFSFGLRMKF